MTTPNDLAPDALTNDQIAMLCGIGEYDLSKLDGTRRRDLERLLDEGYAEPVQGRPGAVLQLTTKGSDFLAERGVGLNEA